MSTFFLQNFKKLKYMYVAQNQSNVNYWFLDIYVTLIYTKVLPVENLSKQLIFV